MSQEGGPAPVYKGYRPRPALIPITAGRVDPAKSPEYRLTLTRNAPDPPVIANADAPYVGITVDGTPIPGLFALADEDLDPDPLVGAAQDWLAALDPSDRAKATVGLDGREWQLWTNAFPAWEPHGVLLDELDDDRRDRALALLRASFSVRGFADVREAMALNGALGRLIDQYPDSLREWMYWLTIFGHPSAAEPWGWQLMGHHVDLHCLVVGRQLVMTPAFLGAEHDADLIFGAQRAAAIELHDGLSADARRKAVLYPSILADDLPPEIGGRVDGRTIGGAGQDNRIVPYTGVCATDLSVGERELLAALADTFVTRLPEGPARHRNAAIAAHLPDTYFTWIGRAGPEEAFYFRIHSPVILAEYDNHPGIFLDFDEPQPFHVHSVVRTPNGNDYGKDLLRAHYEAHHNHPH